MSTEINEIYAFVALNPEGEGIIGQNVNLMGKEMFMPFVFSDKKMLEALKLIAKKHATIGQRTVKLIKLTERTVLEEFLPE